MVHDLCLDSTGPAVADVQVSDVYGVDVVVVNKVCWCHKVELLELLVYNEPSYIFVVFFAIQN